MKILFATSEAVPYWKTGGLADVARALPDALAARGHDVVIMLPLYASVRVGKPPLKEVGRAWLSWPGGPAPVRYLEHRPATGARAVLVDQPAFFHTDSPYGAPSGDPLEPGLRFAFFCRAVVERARTWGVDVVHLNDWQTGLVPVYARMDGPPIVTVFAIHNLAYQGNFSPEIIPRIGVPWELYRPDEGIEFYGQASFMKAGLALSDRLVTVSPTYAREIQRPEYGAGFDGLLRHRRDVLSGILNGLDPRTWDPATDPAVPTPYDADHLDGKEANRAALLQELGFEDGAPLFVMVTRLAHQKGIDMVVAALPRLLRRRMRIAVLGDGDPAYEKALARGIARHARRAAAFFRFDDKLARRLYAGGDFFLMPSLYEPCGLGQMIAQRYGTPPVVRHTGGLVDTVEDGVTGFAFHQRSAEALCGAVERAAAAWRGPDWDELRRRCMRLDRSWTHSAAAYEALYEAARRGATG